LGAVLPGQMRIDLASADLSYHMMTHIMLPARKLSSAMTKP